LLAHVHLKSAQWAPTRTRRDGSTEWRPSFAPLRTGAVDVRALFTALRTVGYDGWVSFEDFSTEAPLDERTPDNLAYARDVLEQVDGRG
jgi:sugar phosphate isomerase/epimerase